MPLISVPAVYDGTNIALLEKPPSRTPYRVLVTFVQPADAAEMRRQHGSFFRIVRCLARRPARRGYAGRYP